jgi:pyruvate dehydrogenase E1 component alpha subunit
MHLYSRQHLAASSGIVGSSGPAGAGFALAGRILRPGSLALAFFGEGALNQGMLMEAMNLAVAWQLPLIFVCKDNNWSITTASDSVTGGDPMQRAGGFGLPATAVDGADVEAVWQAAGQAFERARQGGGPSFIWARCRHFEGHFLGYQALRVSRAPLGELDLGRSLLKSLFGQGASLAQKSANVGAIVDLIRSAREESKAREDDPLFRTRPALTNNPERLNEIETAVQAEMETVVEKALRPGAGTGEQR